MAYSSTNLIPPAPRSLVAKKNKYLTSNVSNNRDHSNPPMNDTNGQGIKRGILPCPDCQGSKRVYDENDNIVECGKCIIENAIQEVVTS